MPVVLSCTVLRPSWSFFILNPSASPVSLFFSRKLFIDTFCKEHRVQFQASPILKPRRQFGEVVAVKIKDNLQGLTTSFNVVEDMSIWRNKDKTLDALPQQEQRETTAI